MRLQRFQYDMLLRDANIKLGMSDYNDGLWTEIKNEEQATDYEIGRLLAAGIKSGSVRFIDGQFPKVEIDDFDVYRGSDYHARIGHHVSSSSPPPKETEY